MMGGFPMGETTSLTFLNLGSPTGLKFVVERGASRAMFEMGVEHAPGAMPFSLGLRPRPGRELADLQAGDLIFYENNQHMAIYVGNGIVVHAPSTGSKIQYAPWNMLPIDAVRRVV